MIRWPFRSRRLSPQEKAERASALAVPTQAVGHVRAQKMRATNNGLFAGLSPEARARVQAKFEAAEGAR